MMGEIVFDKKHIPRFLGTQVFSDVLREWGKNIMGVHGVQSIDEEPESLNYR
jgi:hypothetical protein